MFDPTRLHESIPSPLRRFCLGAFLLPVCLAIGCGEPSACIFMDNGGDAAMLVRVDDKPAAMILPGRSDTILLPPGTYEFHVMRGGSTLFKGSKTLEPSNRFGVGRHYLWNPGGDNRYAACKVVYGSTAITDATNDALVGFAEKYTGQKVDAIRVQYIQLKRYAEPMPADAWFELPSGIPYVLRNPPEFVYTRTGAESRRALTRITQQDHARLRQAHAVENPTERDLRLLTQVTEQALDSIADLAPTS